MVFIWQKEPFELFHLACKDNNTTSICYVSKDWFESWYNFALNQSYNIPGPINNSVLHADNFVEQSFPLTYTQWCYLVSVYGGGPELCITPTRMDLVKAWLGSNDFLSVGDTDEELRTPSCCTADEDCDLTDASDSQIPDSMDFDWRKNHSSFYSMISLWIEYSFRHSIFVFVLWRNFLWHFCQSLDRHLTLYQLPVGQQKCRE